MSFFSRIQKPPPFLKIQISRLENAFREGEPADRAGDTGSGPGHSAGCRRPCPRCRTYAPAGPRPSRSRGPGQGAFPFGLGNGLDHLAGAQRLRVLGAEKATVLPVDEELHQGVQVLYIEHGPAVFDFRKEGEPVRHFFQCAEVSGAALAVDSEEAGEWPPGSWPRPALAAPALPPAC